MKAKWRSDKNCVESVKAFHNFSSFPTKMDDYENEK